MKLTEETKRAIDAKSYKQLLDRWRHASSGDPWFQGETGDYWAARMKELRQGIGGDKMNTAVSKGIGWV